MRLSISRKLALTISAAIVIAGAVTGALTLWQDYARYGRSQRAALVATASAFAAVVSQPLAEGDKERIFEALRGFGAVSRFLYAAVRSPDGEVLSQVGMSARLDNDATIGGRDADGSVFDLLTSHAIRVFVPIEDAGIRVGELELLSNADGLWSELLQSLLISLAGTGFALVVGLAFAIRLQGSIIRPLKSLTAAMGRVRDEHDFDARLPLAGDDEIGILVAGYNEMLTDIQTRDVQLVRHRDRLEQDVADRTHDLALARDAAERANAAKSDFLATMSHEIRTPMSGMLVMAELLASGELAPRSRRYAEVISQSGKALLAIINDILDFAKIEAGKMDLETVPVDLEEVAGRVLNLFYARAREKGLDLAARLSPDLPAAVEGDPVRLGQVISNLVGNALKFTESGAVTIEVETLAGRGVRIAVTDTGIGIPQDKLDTIFEAFGQADQSTTRRYGGTGLGLAISNRLVRAFGSVITVESEVGRGSTFGFVLQTAVIGPPRLWPRLVGHRALVAVEGAATRGAVADMVWQAGCDVEQQELSDGAMPQPCHLVVADSAKLRASGSRPKATYVIALAPPDETSDPHVSHLADATITRPVLPSEVRRLLDLVSRGEALTAHDRSIGTSPLTTYPNARVLAADDAAVNREVLIGALGRFGIRPTLVSNGAEALAAMQAETFDLVLMDGSMPVLDGFEACRRQRVLEAESGSRRTPIVALTAHVVGAVAEAWREAEMDGILHKPFTMDDLDRCLARWLPGGTAPQSERSNDETHAEPNNPQRQSELPLLNPAVLDEIVSMSQSTGSDFARRVFGLFQHHAPAALDTLEEAALSRDAAGVASSAHAIKSMSHNIGAARVAECAGRIEQRARDNDLDGSGVAELRNALMETVAELVSTGRVDPIGVDPGSWTARTG